jgi:secreted PhoX family phosphatase
LKLSTGLTSRIIATKNTKVQYDTGGQSTVNFHTAPDGAAVFADPATGGWIYVSNSESSSDGGVGAITFNSDGQVIEYKRILIGTKRNCGGGKTYWNTWLTCEETEGGQVWEVDPWGNSPGRQTIMGGAGAAYESAAYDKRNPVAPTFYITTDEENGPLVKFTPDETAVTDAVAADNFTNLLHTNGPTVKYEYFKVNTINESTGLGTYVWTSDLSEGRSSAMTYFVEGEGIDIRDGVMYFTTKADKLLWIINLDDGTFQRTSTQSGAFDSQPDQVARVLNYTDGSTDGILYFCEDGGDNCGVHGRDASGQFFTILSDAGATFSGETSGLAFSPDGMFMYVAFQTPGHIFEIRRTDGLPFQGSRLDIKYHESDDNTNPFRDLVETHQGKAPDASGCEKRKAG